MPRVVVAGSENDPRVAVINFTNPAAVPAPVLINPLFSPLSGSRVAISGTSAVAGAVLGGEVRLIDVTNPAAPALRGMQDTALDGIGAIAISGGLVAVGEYVNSFGARIKLIDFSTPGSPVIVGTATTVLTNITIPHADDPADTSAAIQSIAFIRPRVIVAGGPSSPLAVQVDFSGATAVVSTFTPVATAPSLDGDLSANRIAVGDNLGFNVKLFDATTHAQLGAPAPTTLGGVNSVALSAPRVLAGSANEFAVASILFGAGAPVVAVFDPMLGGGSTTAIEATIGACGAILGTRIKLFNLASTPPTALGPAVDTTLASISTLGLSTFAGAPPGPAISSSAASLVFAPQRVSTMSAGQPIVLTNTGGQPLSLTNIHSTDPRFAVVPSGNHTIAAGSTLTLAVTFTPTAESAFAGSITMGTNDPAHATFSVALSGTGGLPHMMAPTGPLTIPPTPVCLLASTDVVVRNTGAVDLHILGAAIASPFSVTPTALTIPPGGMRPLVITFTPTGSVGSFSGVLTVMSDDSAHALTSITINASAVSAPPTIALAPMSLDFGATPVQFFIGLRVSISNSSPCAPLAVTLTTSGGPYFVTAADPTSLPTSNPPVTASIPAGATTRFVVVFAPTVTGVQSGALMIATNDPVHPSVVVPLSGDGVQVSPASMELVLDRSGSMSGAAQGGTKMEALQAAVHLFADLVISGRGDEMGSVEFDDAVSDLTPLAGFTDAQRVAIEADADNLAPRNFTCIGGAMALAGTDLGASAAARKVMLVFTDGMENTPPTIAAAQSALPAGMEVYAVGLGQPQNISTAALNSIAQSSGGRFFQTDDTLILRKDFVQVLADAYRLNLAADPIVRLPPGGSIDVPVAITQCELRISFIVNWDNPASDVELSVIAPDGTIYGPSSPATNRLVRFGRLARYSYCQIAFPPIDPGSGQAVIGPPQLGTWTMRLRAASLAGAKERCTTSVLVESDLEIKSRFVASDVLTPARLETSMSHLGAPVTDAKVTATLTTPTTSLVAASTPAVIRAAMNADHAPIPCGKRALIKTTERKLVLKFDEKNYRVELPPLRIDGVYRVEVRASGQACGGDFERYESFSIYVGRIADPKRTRVRVVAGGRPNVANIVIEPKDRRGAALGPCLGQRIVASMPKGSAHVIDRLDGSYVVRVSWPPKARNPVARVTIDQVTLRVPVATPPPKRPHAPLKPASPEPRKARRSSPQVRNPAG